MQLKQPNDEYDVIARIPQQQSACARRDLGDSPSAARVWLTRAVQSVPRSISSKGRLRGPMSMNVSVAKLEVDKRRGLNKFV